MKYFCILFFCCFLNTKIFCQNGDFEVKVVSDKYATVKGQLKKVSAEGVAIRDYKGNYLIFRPNEIKRIKVRKRGLTITEGMGAGALTGLGIGAYIWAADENGHLSDNMLETTAYLTVIGAAGGALSGAFSEIINTRLIINVNNSEEKYNATYKKLEKYINRSYVEHVN